MSLVFGGGIELFEGAFPAAEFSSRRRLPSARALLSGAAARLGRRMLMSFERERAEVLGDFAGLARSIGLSGDERALLLGRAPELSASSWRWKPSARRWS